MSFLFRECNQEEIRLIFINATNFISLKHFQIMSNMLLSKRITR